jgi:beta-N-acetylhexosaminidase
MSTSVDRIVHPGQLVMVNIQGTQLDAAQAAFLREHHIRAVCLFRGNLGSEAEVRQLTADLRDVMGEGALIGIDQEGGSVVRATFLPQPPAAMALGACGDVALAETVGEAVGRGIRSLGFNWDFAPVLDVNNNPANPVIAERSFSEDPAEVTRLAGAWMRGALRAGVACCVKHFPGHGDTHVDSHLALPVVDKSLAELQALEFVPFRALRDEAPAMMTAHIVYPQLDPEHPATLSRKVLGGLLRGQWGYGGVVITDSLVMKAIHERYGHDRAAVLALQAGADMVMALGTQDEQRAAIHAIAVARESGALHNDALRTAHARLEALARRFPAAGAVYPEAQRASDDALMRNAWACALTAIGAPRAPRLAQPLRVVTQRSVPGDGVSEAGPSGEQVAALFAGFNDVQLVQLDDLVQFEGETAAHDGRRTVLVSNHRGRYTPASRGWRPDLHLALWNPFQVLDIAAPAVVTWGYADGALDGLRAWLEGRAELPGRSPVRLAPFH